MPRRQNGAFASYSSQSSLSRKGSYDEMLARRQRRLSSHNEQSDSFSHQSKHDSMSGFLDRAYENAAFVEFQDEDNNSNNG